MYNYKFMRIIIIFNSVMKIRLLILEDGTVFK